MNRRRQIAVIFFCAVIVLVLGVIIFAASVNGSQTVEVWVVKQPAAAGATFDQTSVTSAQIHATPDEFQFATAPPDGSFRFALAMDPGDIVRTNDLVAANATVPLTLTLAQAPAVSTGNVVDIYADDSGADTTGSGSTSSANTTGPTLIGHGILVSGVSATSMTIQIPSRLSPQWVVVAAATPTLKLYAIQTFPGAQVPAPPSGNVDSVIQFMNTGAQSGSASTGTTP